MKKGQSGFSAIESLLAIVLVGLVVGIGWYVWHAKQQTQTAKPIAQTHSSDPLSVSYSKPVDVPTGWKPYEDKTIGFSFAYPETWSLKDDGPAKKTMTEKYAWQLTTEDGTSIIVEVTHPTKGRPLYTSLNDWKARGQVADAKYEDITELAAEHGVAFRYTYSPEGAADAKLLIYEKYSLGNNLKLVVGPYSTVSQSNLDRLINTVRFGKVYSE